MPDVSPSAAEFRFYGSLRDFLTSDFGPPPQEPIRYTFWGHPAVKDAIEAQGVPHPEVDLVLINGEQVTFECPLAAGSRVSVYPWIDILPRPEKSLRPPLPSPRRFICDVHLGQLARYLRMLGFDTRYDTGYSDPQLAQTSAEENRILLTRDVDLLKRNRVQIGVFVRSQEPQEQLGEVVNRVGIGDGMDPFSLCLTCNVELGSASPQAIDEQVPPRAREAHNEFVQCPSCESVFWSGTHVERMQSLIETVIESLPNDDSSFGSTA